MQAAVALRDVDLEQYGRFCFIGGPGAETFKENAEVLQVIRDIAVSGKPLGAICIAPLALAAAGVLRGKKATVWDRGGVEAKELAAHGATFTGELVTRDGNIITGNGPGASQEFGRMFTTL